MTSHHEKPGQDNESQDARRHEGDREHHPEEFERKQEAREEREREDGGERE